MQGHVKSPSKYMGQNFRSIQCQVPPPPPHACSGEGGSGHYSGTDFTTHMSLKRLEWPSK